MEKQNDGRKKNIFIFPCLTRHIMEENNYLFMNFSLCPLFLVLLIVHGGIYIISKQNTLFKHFFPISPKLERKYLMEMIVNFPPPLLSPPFTISST